MTGWTVMLRGIGFRAGRSLLVLLIAAIASAAAVATAGYLRASEQSVLTDGLRNAPAYQTNIVLDATGSGTEVPGIDDARLVISQSLGRLPLLRQTFGTPIAAVDTDTAMQGPDPKVENGLAYLAYRQDACAHLTIVGACPSANGQVIFSQRSAAQFHVKIGSKVLVAFGKDVTSGTKTPGANSTVTVVGLYTPHNLNEAYWGGNLYFPGGQDPALSTSNRMDSVFAYSEDDVRASSAATVDMHLEIPLRQKAVTLDQVAALRSDLQKLTVAGSEASLNVTTGTTLVLNQVATSQHSLRTTLPVVAVPLVLLSLFVLFLVVTALTDERSPEIALAKLRGYAAGRAARFGVAEMMGLIVLAAPVGIVAGLLLTEIAARVLLASGTNVEIRWPAIAAGLGVTVAGCLAAWLATRTTLRQSVLALMRRVPARTGWRGGLGVGLAVAFVAASLVAAFLNRKSPIAWLAAPSIAVIAGLLAARVLALVSSQRLRSSKRRGRIVGILAGAWLSRQPGRNRVVAVLTVAVALLVFGAVGWDVGSAARSDSAKDTLGANQVYYVAAPYPTALMAAVHAADPTGNSMAVVRQHQFFQNSYVDLIGVDTSALSKVAVWRDEPAATIAKISTALRPKSAPELTVRGTLTVTADVKTGGGAKFQLGALVSALGQPPVSMPLGTLTKGSSTYSAALGGCSGGCRFLGFTLGRISSSGHADVSLDITSLVATGAAVHDFSNAAQWQHPTNAADSAQLTLTPGPALGIDLSTSDISDAVISYQDSPTQLPVVVAGGSKADDRNATSFTFPELGTDPAPMAVVDRAERIPRVGTDAIMFDLPTAVAMAERTGTLADSSTLTYEVWTTGHTPADFTKKLAGAGILILSSSTIDGDLGQLSRGAPTLSLWFYLFAGGLALLLAVGVVLLGAFVGADARIYEYASLKVAGVRPKVLRGALFREYRSVLGLALVVGLAAGLAGAVLMLPSIQLVAVGGAVGNVPYGSRMLALYTALGATIVAMTAVVLLAMRVLHRATPERLREGVR